MKDNDKTLRDLYGLKYNPFLPNLPAEKLWEPPGFSGFLARVQMLVSMGGFATITGEPGAGKSKVLQLIAGQFDGNGETVVGVMERPQSKLTDFYRELGGHFGVNLKPSNRYGGFQLLRERWRSHIKSTLVRPILLIDEAQECPADCLNELRILSSAEFDSQCLLTTVLCGDLRLSERFRSPDLLPVGSRVRARYALEAWDGEVMAEYLVHALKQAGGSQLMSEGLVQALAEHAEGNLRKLNVLADQLLWEGAERKVDQLDENLYLDVFARPLTGRARKASARRKAA